MKMERTNLIPVGFTLAKGHIVIALEDGYRMRAMLDSETCDSIVLANASSVPLGLEPVESLKLERLKAEWRFSIIHEISYTLSI
jgi:hypothetical protein